MQEPSASEDAAGALGAATVILREADVGRALTRIAHEIAERNSSDRGLCLVGIHRRGAFLAERLRDMLVTLLDCDVPLGDLDIGFYRDDVASRPESPILHATHIDFDVTGRTVVVVDDVLFTGRTVRAAIEALFDYGRPQRVQLAVLVDRGHRELPVRPDYVGKNLPTATSEHVHVRVLELDGVDEVAIATDAKASV
jgi:pyrimidine operon attenuation protein/uracil phosphoribosyltransferase